MRYLLTLIISFFSVLSTAQSLSVSSTSATSGNSVNQFTIAGHSVSISQDNLTQAQGDVSSDVNTRTAISATLGTSGISIYAGNGNKLFTNSYDLKGNDASAKVYVSPDGRAVVRENIANFLFFDSTGKIQNSISNSSQSEEGESISELSADPLFKTIVIYNPKIVRNGAEGSRARVLKQNGQLVNIFNSTDRAIRTVRVSENGQFVGVVSYQAGTDDVVRITDRFGNIIQELSFDQNIVDFRISADGRYITLRSNGRVGAYSMISGERIGSTSFRTTLHFAEYIPEDETIVAITGEESGSILTDVELHAVNLEARSIERQEFSGRLGISDLIPIEIQRTGSGRYVLHGLSQSLNVSVSF